MEMENCIRKLRTLKISDNSLYMKNRIFYLLKNYRKERIKIHIKSGDNLIINMLHRYPTV